MKGALPMKKLSRCLCIICLFIIFLTYLTSCGSPFDRSGYIQGMLDSTYKGIHEPYATLVNETPKTLQDNYEQFIEREAKIWLQFCGINSENQLPEDLYTSIIQLIKDLYQHTAYNVADANRHGVVVLTITSLDIYNAVYADVVKFNDDFKQRNNNYEFTDYTDDEFQKAYLEPIIEIFRSHMEEPSYTEPVTLSIPVSQNHSGTFSISDEDVTAIYNALINYTISDVSK